MTLWPSSRPRPSEIAEEALDLIDVEYEVLPAVFDIDSALKPGAPLVYDEFPGNIIPGGTIDLRA